MKYRHFPAAKAAIPFLCTVSILPINAQDVFNPLVLDETLVTDDRVEGPDAEAGVPTQVTAYRTDTPLRDVPHSITVMTAEQIQQQGLDSIGDVVDYTPGVNTSQGEGHRDAVVFRGVRSTADFFADGVRDDVQYFRSLYNVEQVEVIKGPNALTFGRGGVGGVLNRSFKRAEVGENFHQQQASIDTFGAYGAQIDSNLSLNEWSAFRLNAHYDQLENHRDLYDGERFGVNPTFTFNLGADTDLRFSYEYADHDRFIDRGIPSFNGSVAENLSDLTFGDSELNYNNLEAHVFRVALEHRFNEDWTGRVNAFYGTYDKVYSNYYSSDYDGADQVEIDGYIDRTDRQRFATSGDVVGEFFTGPLKHKVLLGAEYAHTSSDQDRYNNVWAEETDSSPDQRFFDISNGYSLRNGVFKDGAGNVLGTGSFTSLADDTETTINVVSAFIQDEIAVSEHLDLIVGARFDRFDIEVYDNETSSSLSSLDQRVTPRFGVVFKPVEPVSIYGSYSETFLPASGEQYTDLVDGSGNPVSDLDPNTSSNIEIGAKWNLSDDLAFSLAGFRILQTNVSNGAVPGTVERVDSEIFGGEAELKGRVSDQWFVSLGYSFLEGENTETGAGLRELPKHTFSLWNNFQVTDKLSLGLGVIYQDESFVDNAATIELPSYTRVDAAARYQFTDDFGVQLNVENLFDKDYYPNAHNNDNISVGAPINARLTFNTRF
ncbi:MAG: TonB-dependent receptor [Verrucomicrobiota bacterium JB023]|nr:TonB-dependent receptor [Verrucomicrobiota bacterium JB023]